MCPRPRKTPGIRRFRDGQCGKVGAELYDKLLREGADMCCFNSNGVKCKLVVMKKWMILLTGIGILAVTSACSLTYRVAPEQNFSEQSHWSDQWLNPLS
jgi:hypothetical protein